MIRSAYVRAAHGAGRVLDRTGLLGRLERRPGRAAGYARSLVAVYDVEAMLRLGLPWWTFRAIDEVERFLDGRAGRARVFEYGSGASTRWLAERAAEVHSVEHDVAFAERIAGPLREAGAVLHVVPAVPSAEPATPSGRGGHGGLDFTDYVATIDRVGGVFDLVVVDGRARVAALERSLAHLEPGGLVVFDDAHRLRYREALGRPDLEVTRTVGMAPSLPYPSCTALARPRTSLRGG